MNMKKGEKTMKERITIRENDSLFFLKIITKAFIPYIQAIMCIFINSFLLFFIG